MSADLDAHSTGQPDQGADAHSARSASTRDDTGRGPGGPADPPSPSDLTRPADQPSPSDLPSMSVRRPYLAAVLNLLIVIAGFAAIFGVEVRELPNVDRPVVTVRALYPGASP
ncbi:MAG: efflux RND transporter permease subunit, partial [Pseudomonadota bacterium]